MPDSTIDPYQAALEFLFARIDYERAAAMPYGQREFRLDRMRDLLAELGNPQDQLAIVHVAGTKGKGSTAAMIGSILTAAGLRCGLFSSPHLDRLEERIAVDGQPCTAADIVDLVAALRPTVAALDREAELGRYASGPTYFELTTAMALLHFVRLPVDVAVLEVGLGGRLDSTNLCRPLVCAITSISFDHTKQLGNTLALIAAEKAGIVKPGVPLVSGVVEDEPAEVIASICASHNARLVQSGRDFTFAYRPPRQVDRLADLGHCEINVADGYHARDLTLGLLGEHQAANAAVAVAVAVELRQQGYQIADEAIRQGLLHVRWPARIEVVSRAPTVIIDAAHNLASIESLLKTLDESFSPRRRHLIFATTVDKDVRGMLKQLLPRFDRVVLTKYLSNPRGVEITELVRLALELGVDHIQAAADPARAWRDVQAGISPEDLVCVTGSFFLAAEIRQLVLNQRE